MSKFLIKRVNPDLYKAEIVCFWQKYLPGTPAKRFEWIQCNPSGSPIWYGAFELKSNSLVGLVSVMPRKIYKGSDLIRAGIVGDFMVAEEYRAFGPALELQKAVLKLVEDANLDFLYTFPNYASIKLLKKLGYREEVRLALFSKPLIFSSFLQKSTNATFAKLIGPMVDIILGVLSKETYMKTNSPTEVIDKFNRQFDDLNRSLVCKNIMTGCREKDYLEWRYKKHPKLATQTLIHKAQNRQKLSGYVVYQIINGKMNIYDIQALTDYNINALLKSIIVLAKQSKCISLNIMLPSMSSYIKTIKSFGFINRNDYSSVLVYDGKNNKKENWEFFMGDTDI